MGEEARKMLIFLGIAMSTMPLVVQGKYFHIQKVLKITHTICITKICAIDCANHGKGIQNMISAPKK